MRELKKREKTLIIFLVILVLCSVGVEVYEKGYQKGEKGAKGKQVTDVREPREIENVDIGKEVVEQETEREEKQSEGGAVGAEIVVDRDRRIIDAKGKKEEVKRDNSIYVKGTTVGVKEVYEVQNFIDPEVEKRKKEFEEAEKRNIGKTPAGLRVAVLERETGEVIKGEEVLKTGVVLIPWYTKRYESVEVMKRMQRLELTYGARVKFLYVGCGYGEETLEVYEKEKEKRGYNCNIYYDTSMTFLGSIGIEDGSEIVFINSDDYVESRLRGNYTENQIVEKLEELQIREKELEELRSNKKVVKQ